jgi:histidinol-phosphate/aromatic aminotransferase/cobyric acid decarboxylase-like protein
MSSLSRHRARPFVPAPGQHGGDGALVAAALGLDPDDVLDLSASLNPVAPDISQLAARHLGSLRHYPDTKVATRALAEAMQVDPSRLLLTNGGAEAIALVADALGGYVEEPEFSLYPRSARGPRWRSNPHNPTGRLAQGDEQAGVWDEAFYPLSTGCWTRGDGAVVVGSLTKLFACPGLRLGYVLADEALIAHLAARQPCWAVNALAVALLPELVSLADLPSWARQIASLRGELEALLGAFGLEPLASQASYVLCENAAGLRQRLASFGVVVRDCASFGLAGHARIAVPTEEGLERLAKALEASAP